MKAHLLYGPSQDPSDRFFGWPTSLLYAVTPAYFCARSEELDVEFLGPVHAPRAFGPDHERRLALARNLGSEADVLCASATCDSFYPTLLMFKEAKESNPSLTTILGGGFLRDSSVVAAAEAWGLADFLVVGDGEDVLVRLLRALSCNEDWRGTVAGAAGVATVSHRGVTVRTTGVRLDPNHLPPIPFALLPDQPGVAMSAGNPPEMLRVAQMMAARGCPYNCWFCDERRDVARHSACSVERVVAEVSLRKEEGFNAIFFDDSTFGAHPHLRELLRELESTGMVFGCLNRFDRLDDAVLLERYRRAGFEYFYCSIEQMDNDTLQSLGKGQSEKLMSSVISSVADQGIQLGVSLLYGVPGESSYSILKTLDAVGSAVSAGRISVVSQSVLAYHGGIHPTTGDRLRFDVAAPNLGYPFTQFEEGCWHHEPWVTSGYLDRILIESMDRFSGALVRGGHSWFARDSSPVAHPC